MQPKSLSLALIVTFLLAACTPAQPAAPPTVVEIPASSVDPTSTSPAPAFPTGRFSAKTEAVQYNQGGTFEFYTDASKIDPVLVGNYTISGDSITISAGDTDPNCQGSFTYKWAFANNALTFSSDKEDPCRGRREANADTYTYDPSYVPEVDISAADYSYISPLKVPSGWVRVVLKNTGSEPHHVQFLRLNDGVTLDQFKGALSKGEGPALAMTQQVGGVGAIAPGLSAQAVVNLPAGNYVILCLIPSASDHVAHDEKGMISGMTAQERSGHGVEPTAGLTVHLKDFEFGMPDAVPSGPLTIQVVNDGPEPHEFNILQIADGKTVNDVVQFLGGAGGPPPFTPIGGMNGLGVGATGYAELNLKPGNYVAICNIPSPKAEGHPHFALGMIKEFTVAP